MKIATLAAVLAVLTLRTSAEADPQAAVAKADWPSFRGPKRDGVSTDTGLLKQWPSGGPPLLWETKGAGRGYASLAIADGKLYTLGDAPSTASDKDEYLLCFDEATGKQLWKTKVGPPWDKHNRDARQESWNSSRSTPTVDGESVYVLTAHGSLIALESASGKERWRKSMQNDLKGKKADGWGYSESPLVDGEKLLVTPGGGQATMACLNKKTGQPIWTAAAPKDRGAGHGSIVVAEVGKTRVYVNLTGGGAIGVRDDGKLLWYYPIDETTAVIPTPIVKGDLVFFSAGYGRGGALLKQVPTADGVKVEEVYPLKKELNNKHGGVILVGDHLYGDTNDAGTPFCADLATGAVKWKGRSAAGGSGSASVAAADGFLYIRYQSGHLSLVAASPESFREVSSFKVPNSGSRPSWSHPVISGQKLFLREGDAILCYDLKAK